MPSVDEFLLGIAILIAVIGGVVSLPILLPQLDADADVRRVYWQTGAPIVIATVIAQIYVCGWIFLHR
jgi:hypothetical protein